MSPRPSDTTRAGSGIPSTLLFFVFFASGAAALIYEVLWLKELSRLFGVTAYATSTTLAVFFLGLALGSLAWGRVAARLVNPLRAYAWLEVGIAISALLYFGLFAAYRAMQEPVFGAIGYRPGVLLGVKFALAAGILLLPAFLMGGTLPVIAQYLVRRREDFGDRVTLLYAINTIGAAAGTLAAGFLLPRWLGFRGSYFVAIGLNLSIAITAWIWSRRPPETEQIDPPEPEPESPRPRLDLRTVFAVAALSGLTTLGLEVVWTRMYAQVLQNSVYTFSIVLAVFLGCLALGAAVANRLCRSSRRPATILANIMLVAGILVSITPIVFQRLVAPSGYHGSDLGFAAYIGQVFLGALLGLGPAIVAMGAIFPYLMKLAERHVQSPGRTVGQLAFVNTAAAIVGSLLAGFVLLGTAGVAGTIRWAAAGYVLASLAIHISRRPAGRVPAVAGVVVLALLVSGLPYRGLDLLAFGRTAEDESVVETWEGPDAKVAVIRHGRDGLRIRVNSSYNLGSSASAVNERVQGQLPLALHPDPRSAFFLGLGTGITASGAMHFPMDRVVVCEVNAEVVRAADKHFAPWLEGLFDAPHVAVLPEDGRTWLSATRESFDVIVADIFLTYKAGIGSMYTVEHFEAVRDRLEPGGVFVQWLPMFDISEPEFEILARSMLEVFPSVTMWRRSLSLGFPVYALVGTMEERPLDVRRLRGVFEGLVAEGKLPERVWLAHIPLAAYVGNLTRVRERYDEAPLNTEDRTVLEYLAPVTERNAHGAGTATVLAWEPLLRFCEDLIAATPPETDPYLAGATPAERAQVRAGTALFGAEVMRGLGRAAEAAAYRRQYERLIGVGGE